jgi:hypothetical protein
VHSLTRGIWRRVRQFFRATFARVRPSEIAEVEAVLTPAQRALFEQMARSDRRHSLDVMNTLRQAGYHDHDLLQAALLHDAGKSVPVEDRPAPIGDKPLPVGGARPTGHGPLRRLTVWHRTAVVLMQKAAPGWLARLAADGQGWKRPFAIHVQHAQTSAELAAQVSCTPKAVALIREHHTRRRPGARAPGSALARDRTSTSNEDQTALLQWADEQN